MKKTTIILVLAVLLVVGGIFALTNNQKEMSFGGDVDTADDVIGTKSGTTITPVGFSVNADSPGQSATTTYKSRISTNWDTAIYSLKIEQASSTPEGGDANMRFSFLGSNDADCLTEAKTNWFDVGNHIRDITYSSSFDTGTTTKPWEDPNTGDGKDIILTNLDYQCLALQASGSSTDMYVQLTGK